MAKLQLSYEGKLDRFPPKSRLVGIELNPGPPKKLKEAKAKLKKDAVKLVKQEFGKRIGKSIATNRKKNGAGFFPGVPGKIGRFLGGIVGQKGLGEAAGNWIGSITGLGDYKIKYNTLQRDVGATPAFKNHTNWRFSKTEFLGTIESGTTAFALSYNQPLNPSNSVMFPWLAQVAPLFERYKFHGLVFEYKTLSGISVASTNTALGWTMMATQYDVHDPPFSNKQQMEDYMFSTKSIAPAYTYYHGVECEPNSMPVKSYLIKPPSLPSGADLSFYDLGNFQFAVGGSQATCQVGELRVTYDIEMMLPRVPDPAVDFSIVYSSKSAPVVDYNIWHNNSSYFLSNVNQTKRFIVEPAFTESTLVLGAVLDEATYEFVPGRYLAIIAADYYSVGGNIAWITTGNYTAVGSATILQNMVGQSAASASSYTAVVLFDAAAWGDGIAVNSFTWHATLSPPATATPCYTMLLKVPDTFTMDGTPPILSGPSAIEDRLKFLERQFQLLTSGPSLPSSSRKLSIDSDDEFKEAIRSDLLPPSVSNNGSLKFSLNDLTESAIIKIKSRLP
uniref:Capsid protein n=1 Tax=Riboviria sp. TaxID=2585031 RepID=A0A514D0D5_9VIRU|nr:MAG: hypothetical protein H3Bulk40135_000001 [Riboviria sp.]